MLSFDIVAVLLSCAFAFVTAIPSPQSIGSDVSILTHNDLYGAASPRQAAAIVLSAPQSNSEAISSCAALGETLWIFGNTSQDLGFLRYLDYNKTTNDVGVYWIGGSWDQCRTIDTNGRIKIGLCDSHFPALCSQSASLSSPVNVDTSIKWQTLVHTGNASIIGYRDKLSFRFLGLKYGSIPARFEYSIYAPPSSANVSALAYGPQCYQAGCAGNNCSETCLFLNVWTPYLPNGKSSTGRKKAVMVWIHGGGFTSGSGSDTTFDGGNMASRGDVVVVTINYRLSTLGFLALKDTPIKGNYGIADQITALDWIRAHIEDFGGDKDRITVFGQSAGAASVRALLATSQARGKFSGAIMQSTPEGAGYSSTFAQYMSIPEATELTEALVSEVGCGQMDASMTLTCLRTQDPVKIVGGRNGTWTGTVARNTVLDGTYLTTGWLVMSATVPRTNVSVMMGTMRDDGAPFSKFSKSTNASQALTEQGFNASRILESNEFPLPQGGNATIDIFNLTARVTTDAEFRCLGQSTASVGSGDSGNGFFSAVYSYEFDRAYQITEWSPNSPTCEAPKTLERPYGDTRLPYFRCHSGELYYVFGTLVRQGRPPRDEDDIPFSQYIVDTWTAFAREKDPNPKTGFLATRGFTNTSATVEQAGVWRTAKTNGTQLRVLDTKVRDENFRESQQCEVLQLGLNYWSDLLFSAERAQDDLVAHVVS